jgi:3-hydroxybutyryl-CoA dehydrogenase
MTEPAIIGIVGAGLMGHGIAQVLATAGHTVHVHDPSTDSLATLNDRIASNLATLGQDPAAMDRVSGFAELEAAVGGADVVFEAAPEKLPLKQSIFADLERMARPQALLASNTSVIPIGQIAERVASKHRVVGTHWWNPPYLVPLVEVIQADETAATTVERMLDLLRSVGKTPVHVKKDVAGFVGNRLQHALWREAVALVDEGVCDAETVDTVVKASFGRRLAVLGPLENADLVGTDLTLDIHEHVLPALNRSPEPAPVLRRLVSEGRLGMKTGGGFRSWTDDEADTVRQAVSNHLRTMADMLDEPSQQ